MAHLLVSAAHKSSGKTTLTLGLAAALARRGLAVQPFKKGPDYIDPMWLALAAGRPCRNLDFQLMSRAEIVETFARHAMRADLSLIEGNKGLYDGLALDGSNSNAALARLLGAPVVLVIDARGMTRGIAPLILGYQAFEPDLRIAGVILNNLGGGRHEAKLRAVIEHYTDVPVLGGVPRQAALEIVERHLGLVPSNEAAAAVERVAAIGETVAQSVDLDALLRIAVQADPIAPTFAGPAQGAESSSAEPPAPVRIGIARDSAFGFYYADDLDALREAGAQLVPFDALRDAALPAVDGLVIGGGFPETHLEALEANANLRAEIRGAVERGLPVYAECGGLMYLAERIEWKGRSARMVGAIPGSIRMHERPVGRGYARLRPTASAPWDCPAPGGELPAHEFHYSSIEGLPRDTRFAFDVLRGYGVDGARDGIVQRNVLALYCHLRGAGANGWAAPFVGFVRKVKRAAPSLRAAA